MNESAEPAPTDRVECTAARDPAVRLFIFAAMMIGFGAWCLTDLRKVPESWELKNINEVAGYLLNNWGPVLLVPAGMIALAWGVIFLRRKLVADAEGIGYEGRQRIAWSDVTRLDAAELKGKGLLYLHRGEAKPLRLDSWKLNNFKAMVAFVERHVPEGVVQTQPEDA